MTHPRNPTAPRPARCPGRWLVAGVVLQALATPTLLAVGPIGFDEPEFSPLQPVHGMIVRSLHDVRIAPLSFGFWVGGASSMEARIGGGGPATSIYVNEPGIEGPASGLLRIDFGTEVTLAGFGFAFDVNSSLGDRVILRASRPGGEEVTLGIFVARDDGLFSGNRVELGSPEPFTQLEVVFQTTGRRFLVDDLYYRLWDGPASLDETRVRARGRGSQAAVDSTGRRILSWLEGGHVWAQLVGHHGLPLSEALRVSDQPSDAAAAAVSFDPRGEFTVAWAGESNEGTVAGVRARLFAANGAPVSQPLVVSTALAQGITVAHLPGGEPVILWEQNDTVRGRILKLDGESLAPAFSLGPGRQRAPAVAASPSGAYAVAWLQPEPEEVPGETARAAIYVRFFSGDGAVTRPIRVNEEVRGAPSAPAVAVDGRGDAIVVWQQLKDGRYDIFARRVSSEGFFLGPEQQVNSLSVGEQGAPAVGANLSGDFTVAWESAPPLEASDSTGDRQVKVVSRSFNRLGQAIGSDFTVAESLPGEWVGAPSVTLAEDNSVLVLFERRDSTGEELGIFARSLETELGASGCAARSRTLCLHDGRFRVEVSWIDPAGQLGAGNARRLTSDTGSFWFFSPDNLELVVKILDATALNGHWWVFYGALSNVEYDLTVSDLYTGRSRTYHNPMGHFASVGDTQALADSAVGTQSRVQVIDTTQLEAQVEGVLSNGGTPWSAGLHAVAIPAEAPSVVTEGGEGSPWSAAASSGLSQGHAGGCLEGPTVLCLQRSRFQLEIEWSDFAGQAGLGRAAELTGDSGYFWFFEPGNVEVVVKVLDGREVNGYFWVFYGALTNVEFELGVLDTGTGTYRLYRNELGTFASTGDTEAIQP